MYKRLPPLSRRLMQDPTQSQRLVDRYEHKLVVLFREWNWSLVMAVKGSGITNAIDPTDFKAVMDGLKMTIVTGPAEEIISEQMETALSHGSTFGEKAVNQLGLKVVIGQGPLDRESLKALETRNLSGLDNITEATSATIIREITDGNNLGESVHQIARRITKAVEGIGIERARVLAQYETMYAVNTGACNRYRQSGIQYVEWLDAGDDHCCDQCLGYGNDNEGIYKIEEAPVAPAHPRCRCALAPVIRVMGPEEESLAFGKESIDQESGFAETLASIGKNKFVIRREVDYASTDSVDMVKGTLEAIPKRELDKAAIKTIEIYDNPEDLMSRLTERGVDFDPGDYVRGAYDVRTKTIYASVYDADLGVSTNKNLLHEIGHSIVGLDEEINEIWLKNYGSLIVEKVDEMKPWTSYFGAGKKAAKHGVKV